MAYTQHKLVQDDGIAQVSSGLVSKNLPVLQLFNTFAPDQHFGYDGGIVNLKTPGSYLRIPGSLPSRKYGWRNDRSEPIQVDTYEERVIPLDIQKPENHYSAVQLTDEQKEYDLNGSFGDLTVHQTTAIVNTLNSEGRDFILNAPYELGIAVDVTRATMLADREIGQDSWYNGFIEARQQLNKMGVPQLGRAAMVGSAVAAGLMKNAKIDKIQGNNTPHVFAESALGNFAGFTVIEDTTGLVPADEAFLFDASGFLFWSFAPAIPEGAVRGARTNQDGVGLRWVVDYDPGYMVERSVWNSWNAFGYAKDFVQGVDTNGAQALGTEQYFVKGVKVTFQDGVQGAFHPGDGGEAINDRKGASADSELARYYANEPLRAGRQFVGEYYPSILQGNVNIGDKPTEDANGNPVGGGTSGE